jgi:hypothetical protein
VNLVKLQYALSGDANWNSVEHPFIAQELFENFQTLHGPQIANSKSHFISIKIYFILRDYGTKITINPSLVVVYEKLIVI